MNPKCTKRPKNDTQYKQVLSKLKREIQTDDEILVSQVNLYFVIFEQTMVKSRLLVDLYTVILVPIYSLLQQHCYLINSIQQNIVFLFSFSTNNWLKKPSIFALIYYLWLKKGKKRETYCKWHVCKTIVKLKSHINTLIVFTAFLFMGLNFPSDSTFASIDRSLTLPSIE